MSLPSRPGRSFQCQTWEKRCWYMGSVVKTPFYNRFKGESSDFLVRVTFTEALVYIGEAAH